jgi:UDPglucose 6-dehydrogenase
MTAQTVIGVVGNGTVGGATARVWMEHAEVRVYDTVKQKRTHHLKDVLDADVVFVCLPTPKYTDGGYDCDTTAILDFFRELPDVYRTRSYALRSTVPIGFTRQCRDQFNLRNLVHNPEFLTARCAAVDAQTPTRNIIGGEMVDGYDVAALYRRRFPGVPTMVVRPESSELIKLGQNAFFATKVAFFNELNTLAVAAGADWSEVIAGILADGRISHSHTSVPGPDRKYGFGGECLPKDLASLIACLDKFGVRRDVASGVYSRNEADRLRTSNLAGRTVVPNPTGVPDDA